MSIVHTVEAMQVAVEEFNEHIETCNVDFKFCVFDKVKTLKGKDTVTLSERVSTSHFYVQILTISFSLFAKGRRIEGIRRFGAEYSERHLC